MSMKPFIYSFLFAYTTLLITACNPVCDDTLNQSANYYLVCTDTSNLITKVKYILYDNKGDIVSHYINYMASKTGEGDLEVFYNPFLLVKVLKRSRCDTYEEAPKKYQQMINQTIIIQPRM